MDGSKKPDIDAGRPYAFRAFVLDPAREMLMGPDGEITLRPKSFAVLRYLVEHPGRLCTKDELLAAVWGQTVVTEDSLTQCLVEIRRALGDRDRSMIRTVPRRGYLLTAEVRRVGPEPAGVGPGAAAAEPGPPAQAGVAAHPAAVAPAVVPRDDPGGSPRHSWRGFESLIAGAMIVVLFAFVTWRAVFPPGPAIELPVELSEAEIAARGTTLAVLPFADMSPGGDHAYFGDGMAEEILNLLAEASGLRVIARTSSFSLRDQPLDIPAMGRRLGATHILEGSVRPDGERMRVTAQLVDARDGAHLWSETYDRPLGDVLALQDEIAGSVAALLHATFATHAAKPAIDPQAYEHKLRGAYLFSRRSEGDVEAAQAQFEAALAIEPDYAQAWVGLAGVRWIQMLADDRVEPEELEGFREAALRGVELGPHLPEAHLRAQAAYRMAQDSAMTDRHVGIARKLDPENPLLLGLLAGRAIGEGNLAEALDYQYRAVRGDPLSFLHRANLAYFLLAAGRLEDAREQFGTFVELGGTDDELEAVLLLLEGRPAEAWDVLSRGPGDEFRVAHGAMALQRLGRTDEARARIEPLASLPNYRAAMALAEFHAWRGDTETGLEWLRQARGRLAMVTGVPSVPSWSQLLTMSPFIDPLRADSRFGEIARMP